MYFKKLKTAAQLMIVVCVIAFASCKKTEYLYFSIIIDKISIPDTVHISDSFNVHLYGYIGPTKCYVFEGANFLTIDTRAQNEIFIEAIGKQNTKDCGGGDSILDDEIVVWFKELGEFIFYDINKQDVELGRIVVIP